MPDAEEPVRFTIPVVEEITVFIRPGTYDNGNAYYDIVRQDNGEVYDTYEDLDDDDEDVTPDWVLRDKVDCARDLIGDW